MKRVSRSFISGYSRALDLFSVRKPRRNFRNGNHKDYLSLKGDWAKVGEAISKATESFKTC